MALDDTCSDFFSLLDLTPKARPPDRRLNGCTGARSDFSCSILIATPIRQQTLIALCDAILGDWEAPAMAVIFQRLLRLREHYSMMATIFPVARKAMRPHAG